MESASIELRVAGKSDFVLSFYLLFLAVILAAVLSPQPFYLTLLAALVFCAVRLVYTLYFNNINAVKLTSVIFSDGRVKLISSRKDTIEGFLDSQQWCTHWLAVLRVVSGGTIHRLVILSTQQQKADDFRRLNMWLRQNICDDALKVKVSLNDPRSGFVKRFPDVLGSSNGDN